MEEEGRAADGFILLGGGRGGTEEGAFLFSYFSALFPGRPRALYNGLSGRERLARVQVWKGEQGTRHWLGNHTLAPTGSQLK